MNGEIDMKVRCIDNARGVFDLTIGKEYEVLEGKDNDYQIIDDNGCSKYVLKKRFEVIEEEKQVDSKIYGMGEFNWGEFKEGKIAVWCETRELREDFLKQCDNHGVRWRTNGELASDNIEVTSCEGEDCTAYVCKNFGIAFSDYNWFQEQGIKVIKWSIGENNKIYKGWEIVKMISEGKIADFTRLRDEDGFSYTVINNCLLDGVRLKFSSDYETKASFIIESEFTIVERQKFTTDIAFKEYMEGKMIESYVTGCKYQKDRIFGSMNRAEFEGLWYIEGR